MLNQKILYLAYASTIFVGAFLLFQVQPIIGKYILPWFGGSPSVWSVAMLFFMTVLLIGYAYAHALSRFSKRVQIIVHLALTAIALFGIWFTLHVWGSPLTPGREWIPAEGTPPALSVLRVLAVSIGIPYFLLSTTSSLFQSWWSRFPNASSPYSFYTLSNLASLLAVLSYPFLVEPNFSLLSQGILWSYGYFLYGALVLVGAFLFFRYGTGEVSVEAKTDGNTKEEPSRKTIRMWLGLSTLSAVVLLAVTNKITQSIATVPFLWLLPLSLYLLSYIIAFSGSRFYNRLLFSAGLLVLIFTTIAFGETGKINNFLLLTGLYSLVLFISCLVCHIELYENRPHSRYLTKFYLIISAGGVLGGIFVGLLAPVLFRGFWEVPLALLGSALLAFSLILRSDFEVTRFQRIAITGALIFVACFTAFKTANNMIEVDRNFYGLLSVYEAGLGKDSVGRFISNGKIVHGSQFLSVAKRKFPTSYYGENSGVGLAIIHHPKREKEEPLRVGVIGLGAGVLAAYGKTGDTFIFYEINRDVLRIAKEFFTFLSDSPAKVEIVLGDARLSLEKELGTGTSDGLDVLAVDAFSDDAIPVHLLTKEAFELYKKHLSVGGILAVHISNRHLDLYPVVLGLAEETGLRSERINSVPIDEKGVLKSEWVLLSLPETESIAFLAGVVPSPTDENIKPIVWTDNYSNLFKVLR